MAKISWRDVPVTNREGAVTGEARLALLRSYRDSGEMGEAWPVSQDEFNGPWDDDGPKASGPAPDQIDWDGLGGEQISAAEGTAGEWAREHGEELVGHPDCGDGWLFRTQSEAEEMRRRLLKAGYRDDEIMNRRATNVGRTWKVETTRNGERRMAGFDAD
jgi:hypothetical protein